MSRSRFVGPAALAAAIAAAAELFLAAAGAHGQLTDLGAILVSECVSLGDCGANDGFGGALAVGDFDDDGFADLAVGVPGETVNGHATAGSVHVYYGSRGGLQLTGDAVFDQDSADVPGAAEDGDRFGFALAAGDFNHDGIDDLAVGAPFEDLGSAADAGAVLVLFGSATGLTTAGSLSISQNTFPSPESAEPGDLFGYALSGGDEHGDGSDWLAIGVPGEDLGLFDTNEGIVEIIESVAGTPLQAMDEVQQTGCDGAEAGDRFGSSVAHLRHAVSGFADRLVVGAPNEDSLSGSDTGCVDELIRYWSQDSLDVPGSQETDDRFGSSLTAGDFDGNGHQDLAVGVVGEDVGSVADAGGINVLYGSSSGALTGSGSQFFSQNSFATSTGAEAGDGFGRSLAAGDFDGDGRDDLAIGAPSDSVGSATQAGEVDVLYGTTASGLSTVGNQAFDQGTAGMPGTPESGDFWGWALATGDFDGNGVADLAVGAPDENLGGGNEGEVTVLYGLHRNNDAFGTVQFTTNLITVPEPATDTAQLVIITRTLSAVVGASVDYDRIGGTATPGVDFSLTPGTKTWAAGSTSPKAFTVTIHPDTVDDNDETIVLRLSNPTPGTAVGSPGQLTLVIEDDDVAGSLSFHVASLAVAENAGSATIRVDRNGGAASDVTVHYATANGTATAGVDYTATSGTLTFAADQASATFQVPILDDGIAELGETVILTLSSPGGGGQLTAPSTATLTITDNDPFVDSFESGNLGLWSAKKP